MVGLFQKREIPWEKVPFVPRPSLVPDPVTAFGKRDPKKSLKKDKLITDPLERAKIRPKELLSPIKPYVSARDATREKVFSEILREGLAPSELPSSSSMDIVLPRLHKVAEVKDLPYKRRIVASSEFY